MRVAIAGYGAEGQSSYRYFTQHGHDVTIVTNRVSPLYPIPEGAKSIIAEDAFEQLSDFEMVIRTPPMAPILVKTNGKVWSQTNEFFDKCPAPIIGVTGTKGKGTTCSLVASVLQKAGKTVHLVGNIGLPPLDVLQKISADDFVVYELSSFQLWDAQKSPHVAVVLMIEQDHLDIHASFAEYIDAKANIRRHQTVGDVCIYHPTNQYSRQIAGVELSDWREGSEESIDLASRYGVQDDDQVFVKDGYFCVQDRQICTIDNLRLPGMHNLDNACAAISAAIAAADGVTDEAVASGLRAFEGLPHRLKRAAIVDGVSYFDDSIATTPGSVIAALRAFTVPKVLIIGGADKGADYGELIDEIANSQSIRAVVVIGSNADQLSGLLQDRVDATAVSNVGMVPMGKVVATAADYAQRGDVVILSPASASFDQYKNYADRGDQFAQEAERLAS